MTPDELPTEPYAVIRVRRKGASESTAMVCSGSEWHTLLGGPILRPEELAREITSFEVLSSPTQKHYPFIDGPHLVIGPECFTGDGDEVDQTVISWRGENYYVPARVGLVLTQEEAAYAVEAIESMLGQTYDRTRLLALGALAHKLDPDFPAPEYDDEDVV